MTEQKEFESLDELFRKTFDNLPDTPAASGWDTPSEKVWNHVHNHIAAPKTGWSAQSVTLVAAFAVTLAVGLYLLFNRPDQPESPARTPVATEMPETAANETREPAAMPAPTLQDKTPGDASITSSTTEEGKVEKALRTRPAKKSAQQQAAEWTGADSSSEKPVETPAKKAPNTTLRLKAQLARQAEKAWKEDVTLLPQRWPAGIEQ